MAKAGYIREYLQMPIGGKMGSVYLASEVQSLVERFRSMTNAPPTSTVGRNLGDVLVPVMKGRVRPSANDPATRGFLALLFPAPGQNCRASATSMLP